MSLTSKEIIEKFIDFYKQKDHVQIPNVSLLPQNDSTLLFVNAGMFPLVPYLMGEVHPMGSRLVNVQRCIRFEDIEEVGDNRHTTAFHMLGNWSLNDYFKEEQLNWVYTLFLDDFGLDIHRVYPSVFAGNSSVPKDDVSARILKEIFKERGLELKENERLFFYEGNWWMRGDAVGELGGPDSEIYYYIGSDTETYGLGENPEENEDEFIEIGNSVFMQYIKTEGGWEQMDMKNVDFGGGLERIAMVVQGKNDIYQTDCFLPIIRKIESLASLSYGEDREVTRHMRILADHIRSSVFLAMDGISPSNKDQGYILRRLLRRIVRSGKSLGMEKDISVELVSVVVDMFEWLYPSLVDKQKDIEDVFSKEEGKFRKTLRKASREVDKFLESVDASFTEEDLAKQAFNFYQSLGYPEEIFMEDLREQGIDFNTKEFISEFKELQAKHKEKSRRGAEKKFKGGLVAENKTTIKYHTATHILHTALRSVLGEEVAQKGSNITSERLRFDFSFSRKLTNEEIKEIEEMTNQVIKAKLPVHFEIMSKKEAFKTQALHLADAVYGDKVKVYYIGEEFDSAFSREFCGGPHVDNTGDLEPLEIYKQKKIGRKIIRVYARFKE